jgi:hypothetical protein
MVVAKDDRLLQAVAEAIPGRECDWARRVRAALAGVERTLRYHTATAESPDGPLTQVDLTRPTLMRRATELCREHGQLLEEVHALQEEVRGIVEAFRPYTELEGAAQALPEPAIETVSDFGALRRRVEHLLTTLRHHMDAEADLVFETVSTDIGVGD